MKFRLVAMIGLVCLVLLPPSVFACQNFCTNCKVTVIDPHSTGNILVSFSSRTDENPDACGNVTKALINHDDPGREEILAILLTARATDSSFGAVRTCGCKTEWSTNWPTIAWMTLLNN